MGLRGTIIAGQIAALDKIRLEGRSAVDSAYREWQTLRQDLMHELENLDAILSKLEEQIKELQIRLNKAQNALKAPQAALQASQSRMSSAKDGSEQRAAASEVARYAADVKMYQAKCTQIFAELKEVTSRRNELQKSRNALVAAIARVDSEGGQNYREARSKYEESCVAVQKAKDLVSSYPGGY